MSVKIITNNHRRPVVDAWELTPAEREQFDYLNWPAIEEGSDSASFFRYRGELHDLGDFMRMSPQEFDWLGGDEAWRRRWHGIATDSFFSATVVRYTDDGTGGDEYGYVVVGRVYS